MLGQPLAPEAGCRCVGEGDPCNDILIDRRLSGPTALAKDLCHAPSPACVVREAGIQAKDRCGLPRSTYGRHRQGSHERGRSGVCGSVRAGRGKDPENGSALTQRSPSPLCVDLKGHACALVVRCRGCPVFRLLPVVVARLLLREHMSGEGRPCAGALGLPGDSSGSSAIAAV